MTTVRQALVATLEHAGQLDLEFAVVGGLAVSAWTEPRTTRDVDLAVNVRDDAQAEDLVFALRHRGYVVETVIEQRVLGRLATARLRPPGAQPGGALVDLLFASSGVEREVVRGARRLELVRGVVAPVASVGHLITMKILSGDEALRPQDLVDLAQLIRCATAQDVDEARALAARIVAVGTNRGRDLGALLTQAMARYRPAPP